MKVLYLTVPSFFDLEISLIRELSKKCEVTVLMIVSPQSQNSSALSLDKLLPSVRIVNASNFDGMEKYANLIDLKRWYIANNPDNSVKSCYKLSRIIIKFIKDGGYDLIHSTTDCKTSVFLLPFVWRFPNKLYTNHDPIPHHKASFLHDIFRRKLYFKVFRNLLFLSPSLIDEFCRRYNVSKRNIYLSKLGPYNFLKSYCVNNKLYDRYILYFGRIAPYKGIDLLTEAFPNSKFAADGYKLILAGKGSLDKSVKGDSNIIFWNRYIENEELANLIANSHFVVLPYRSATQSGCVMSAFAFNKPVLVTDVGDLPLSVVNKRNGIVVPANSVSAIQTGLDSMYDADLVEMSKNISSDYNETGPNSWGKIAYDLLETYSKIINEDINSTQK